MRSESENSKSGPAILTFILAALGLYVLSIGPVARLFMLSPRSQKFEGAAEVFYYPIIALDNTPLSPALTWWVDLWTPALIKPAASR